MVVIAYASGKNGMTTWCLEAAQALQDNGIECCLFCDENVNLQNHDALKTFIINDSFTLPTNFFLKLKVQIWNRLFKSNKILAIQIHDILQANNIVATHIIWNNAVFLNSSLPIPQSIVAWSYPTTMWSYLKKIRNFAQNQKLKALAFSFLDALGFYLSDSKGYKKANSVLAIHDALNNELHSRNINSFLIYPSIALKDEISLDPINGKLKILIVALNLEESRKGISWMLDCLCYADFLNKIEIHLIGTCSSEFETKFTTLLPATFYGILPRADVEQRMQQMDLFLFGSSLDDWGFVQTEAMSNGLAVISPNITPFNEIVPHPNLLFELHSKQSFLEAVQFVLNSDLVSLKALCLDTARQKFSRSIFSKKISNQLIHSSVNNLK